MDTVNNWSLIAVLSVISCVAPAADLTQSAPLTTPEWDRIREHVALLDKISFVPSLLPVIMKHQDALDLSEVQKKAFRTWRKSNYQRMVELMNEIIERRILLSKGALDPALANKDLVREQQQILQLQQELLRVRLSCRKLVMSSFSVDQWEDLAFVLEEYSEFAGLMQ